MRRLNLLGSGPNLITLVLAGMLWMSFSAPATAGPYTDSAHGSYVYGANRSAIDGKYLNYATGNCAHCHESHASVEGSEPSPLTGPVKHGLFANIFNSSQTLSPYAASDNFCYYCHGGGSQVKNQDYSVNFGGAIAGSGPQTIMDAFNQTSYHNLYDISSFLKASPTFSTWFAKVENPCSACHDSHLAKRNWDSSQQGFPLLSAIILPGSSGRLWGETETMSAYFGYEAPIASELGREPAGVGEAGGGNTPDYVTLCISCHNADNAIFSTVLNRELKRISWKTTDLNPEKHGPLSRGAGISLREPYLTAAAMKTNFLLSCLDCHEPHGSPNIMLLRRRINGENLEETVVSTDAMGNVCKRCHTDDFTASAGTAGANRWEYVHHLEADAPYPKANCIDCHSDGNAAVIACGNCHGHGMNDSGAGIHQTGRKTF